MFQVYGIKTRLIKFRIVNLQSENSNFTVFVSEKLSQTQYGVRFIIILKISLLLIHIHIYISATLYK